MTSDKTRPYIGVYGIFIYKDSVLMIKKNRGPYKGKFDLPGGGVEFGEKISTCLAREINEETGSKLLGAEFVGLGEYTCQYVKEDQSLKDFHHIGVYYLVNLEIKDLKTGADGQDSDGALFVPIANISLENTSPIVVPIIEKIRK